MDVARCGGSIVVTSPHYKRPWVHLDLGPSLKRFYVREGTGLELERADRLVVTVRIWRGEAVIQSLMMP